MRTGSMQSLNLQACGSFLPCLATTRPSHRAPRLRRQPGLQVFAVAEVAENRAAVQNGLSFQVNDNFPPAEPEPVSPEVQAIIDEQGLDYETSGLQYLTNEARVSYAQFFLQGYKLSSDPGCALFSFRLMTLYRSIASTEQHGCMSSISCQAHTADSNVYACMVRLLLMLLSHNPSGQSCVSSTGKPKPGDTASKFAPF